MNLVDRLICELDTGLKTVFARTHGKRPQPKTTREPGVKEVLTDRERSESIQLMRINHCGEVSAQALYQGQALVAKDKSVQQLLAVAAAEERDHLAWCESRLSELGGNSSRLAPLFFAGAYGLGVVSGLMGDRWSMGFLVETERQVEAHLDDHLGRVAVADSGSRVILEAMREDEIRHGQSGIQQGAATLPLPVKAAMQVFSKVMTTTTRWV